MLWMQAVSQDMPVGVAMMFLSFLLHDHVLYNGLALLVREEELTSQRHQRSH